ncbi:hypothetical protein AKJ64_04920 [candidate division MSBL1 archaeon SCGC-AAA259E17]|uniref:Uncharacterized protein n=1 Tax=candidate division MSBL1 archaeon SCGC-AAA259E17 TaxID=1698263 RepID=A0A133UAG8_9EURY|nr:hypothetical protein AKJ64_04920 [candidate division MSBL1 archaeon SCGC-AAA259E17]
MLEKRGVLKLLKITHFKLPKFGTPLSFRAEAKRSSKFFLFVNAESHPSFFREEPLTNWAGIMFVVVRWRGNRRRDRDLCFRPLLIKNPIFFICQENRISLGRIKNKGVEINLYTIPRRCVLCNLHHL